MPTIDDTIKDFLIALKIAFKTATIYEKDHPAFTKAVGDLMAKLEALLATRQPGVHRFHSPFGFRRQ